MATVFPDHHCRSSSLRKYHQTAKGIRGSSAAEDLEASFLAFETQNWHLFALPCKYIQVHVRTTTTLVVCSADAVNSHYACHAVFIGVHLRPKLLVPPRNSAFIGMTPKL